MIDAQLEQQIYEYKPHAYALLSFICLYSSKDSFLFMVSGLLFGISSASVFYLRYFARNYR
jgi:hypothetical protein